MFDLDENTITAEVLRRLENTADERLKQVMTSLIEHLHAFAREVQLTEAEWMLGIEFLTRTGQISNSVRQEMILLSDTLGLSQLVVAQNHSRPKGATEQTVFGPFHVEDAPKLQPHGADIGGPTEGPPLWISARVVDLQGHVVPGAIVDVWQSDNEGFYDVQDAGWSADESHLRAVFETDAEGRISFRSILPASYPIPMDGPVGQMMNATHRDPTRPAHIHFMIHKPGFGKLVTHVFVNGDKYLDSDSVFGVRASCIGDFVEQPAGVMPDGIQSDVPFYTLDYTFVLHEAALK